MKSPDSQNSQNERKGMSRRRFMQVAGISAVGASSLGYFNFRSKGVSIVRDPADLVAGSPPSTWAVKDLEDSLTSHGIDAYRCESISQARSGDLIIVVAGSGSSSSQQLLRSAKTNVATVPEALGLVPTNSDGKQVLLACGHDTRGLVYALLELADRVQYSNEPLDALNIQGPVIEQPANAVVGIRIVAGPIPAAFLCIGILFAALYPLGRQSYTQIARDLETRRKGV